MYVGTAPGSLPGTSTLTVSSSAPRSALDVRHAVFDSLHSSLEQRHPVNKKRQIIAGVELVVDDVEQLIDACAKVIDFLLQLIDSVLGPSVIGSLNVPWCPAVVDGWWGLTRVEAGLDSPLEKNAHRDLRLQNCVGLSCNWPIGQHITGMRADSKIVVLIFELTEIRFLSAPCEVGIARSPSLGSTLSRLDSCR